MWVRMIVYCCRILPAVVQHFCDRMMANCLVPHIIPFWKCQTQQHSGKQETSRPCRKRAVRWVLLQCWIWAWCQTQEMNWNLISSSDSGLTWLDRHIQSSWSSWLSANTILQESWCHSWQKWSCQTLMMPQLWLLLAQSRCQTFHNHNESF